MIGTLHLTTHLTVKDVCDVKLERSNEGPIEIWVSSSDM